MWVDMLSVENVDELAGYETGRDQGRQRIGGRLVDREAPEHLTGKRRADWEYGYRTGLRDRPSRSTLVTYTNAAGQRVTRRMGGSHRSIVERLAAQGVTGDVIVATGKGPLHTYGI